MPRCFPALLLGLVAGLASAAPAAAERPVCGLVESYPGAEWREADPQALGWDGDALDEAAALWETLDSAALMVVYRGRLVLARGTVAERYTAQSIRKALLNALIGRLVDQGALSLDATLADLGIDDSDPPLDQAERQATVEHLMLSRSGIFHSANYEVGGWKRIRQELAARRAAGESFAPGDYWVYNNWDFNALGTIVEQAAGEPIGSFFERVVAGPIGMQDFRPENVEYSGRDNPAERFLGNRSDHPAYVFDISTRDLARFGLLYLGCGHWDGEALLSESWVARSFDGVDTRLGRSEEEQETGFGDYGLLWQVDRPGNRRLRDLPFREPVYLGSGHRGHFLLVAPALDLVIVHQVATVGGVSMEAQRERAMNGSPEVSDQDLQRLFRAVIEAHPGAGTAFLP